ncbi:MAG: hypothetical protein V7750_15120 [Sneathiella sp.]
MIKVFVLGAVLSEDKDPINIGDIPGKLAKRTGKKIFMLVG